MTEKNKYDFLRIEQEFLKTCYNDGIIEMDRRLL